MNFLNYFLFYFLGFTFFDHLIVKIIIFIILSIITIKKYRKRSCKYFICFIIGLFLFVFLRFNTFYSRLGIVIVSKDNYFIFRTLFGRYYVPLKSNEFEVFDLLKINGEFTDYNFTTYESQFDFNKYLENNTIYKQIKVIQIKPILYSILRIRRFSSAFLDQYSNLEVKKFLAKLIFNSNIAQDYANQIYQNNLNYYLSLSSFHIVFILEVIKKILNVKLSDKKTDLIVLIFNIFLFVFSNYKTSIFRFLIFRTIIYLNKYKLKVKIERKDQIGLVFLITGVIFPSSLSFDYFLFSFPLYFLIYYAYESSLFFSKSSRKYFYVTLINLYFIALNLYINQNCSLFSLFFGLLLGPYILLIYLLVILSLFLPIKSLVSFLSQGMIKLIDGFSLINLRIYTNHFNLLVVFIFFLIIYRILYLIETGRLKRIIPQFISLGVIILFSMVPFNNLYEKAVYFINVGQGDSILIKDQNTNFLVDTGGINNNDLAKNTLIPFFLKHQVYKIDYLFLTHNDFDHIGASESLIKNFKVKNVIKDSFDSLELENVRIQNLNHYYSLFGNDNDKSLVLHIKFKETYFLLMGDASTKVENMIIKDYPDLRVDYLKIGHHGSVSSTSESFIKQYHPQNAIISVGAKNIYHHPNQKVLNLLNQYQVQILRTDEQGTIKVKVK